MHLLQRTAIHLIFSGPFLIYIFHCISPFFSVPFSLALHMDPSHLSDIHIHPSIHPSSTISSHRLRFISLYVIFFFRLFLHAFLSCIFYALFPLFVSFSSCLCIFRAVFRIYSRGFLVLYMAAVTHTTDLEREAGVESGRLDVPISSPSRSLSSLLTQPPTSTIDNGHTLSGCPDHPRHPLASTSTSTPTSHPRPATLGSHPFTTFYDSPLHVHKSCLPRRMRRISSMKYDFP
jgi:hypothetical protein